MKKVVGFTIAGLVVAFLVCYNTLQETKQRLFETQKKLEIMETTWWRLVQVAITYHRGELRMSVPDYHRRYSGPLVLKNEKWEPGTRYEFFLDGKTARYFRAGVEEEWSPGPH